jgi:diacylglycerol kinase family enzyme
MHNPGAGDEEHEPESLVRVVEAAGHEVRWQSVKEPGWERAVEDAVDLVAIAGGDGTVRKVFRQLAGRSILATILPVGTANNIARSLGFREEEPAVLVRGWASGRTRACDVGSLATRGGERLFVESAGGGLFADLLVRADDAPEAEADDKVEHGLRVLQRMAAEARPHPWRVRIDAYELEDDLVGVEVMNVREAGPRIPLAPEADPGDGLLDVVLLRAADADDLAAFAEARLQGRQAEAPSWQTRRGREILLRPPHESALHFDDQILAEEAAAAGAVEMLVRCSVRLDVLLPNGPGR